MHWDFDVAEGVFKSLSPPLGVSKCFSLLVVPGKEGQDTRRWGEHVCKSVCPVGEKGGRNEGKGLESLPSLSFFFFLLKVKNQSMTLKKFMNF